LEVALICLTSYWAMLFVMQGELFELLKRQSLCVMAA